MSDCALCAEPGGVLPVLELGALEVWDDDHWRLLADLRSEVIGYSLLVPKRHAAQLHDLGADEARTLGPALVNAAGALKAESDADAVYLYAFEHPHLHLHLAPHRAGDALSSEILRGKTATEALTNSGGLHRQTSRDFPPLPAHELRAVAERVRRRLCG